MKRVSVVTSASGNGGTTFSRELAVRMGVPFHELDALFWKPGWVESTADEFRALLEPIVASEAWVVDGSYQSKIGDLVFRNADLVVWLDLPWYVWLPRQLGRTFRPYRRSRAALERQSRDRAQRVLQPRLAPLVHVEVVPAAAARLPRAAGALSLGPPPLGVGGRQVSQERETRDLSSATQAAARRPSQIGVRST
jgi:hypothetical protein